MDRVSHEQDEDEPVEVPVCKPHEVFDTWFLLS